MIDFKGLIMKKRIPISIGEILKNEYARSFNYQLIRNFTNNNSLILSDNICRGYNNRLDYFDINLLIKDSMTLIDLKHLKTISENIIVGGYVAISNCPLLKTIPLKFTKGLEIFFTQDQHLITILSEEQFKSLKGLSINDNFIKTYKEYYSFIKPTLEKEQLLKVCTL